MKSRLFNNPMKRILLLALLVAMAASTFELVHNMLNMDATEKVVDFGRRFVGEAVTLSVDVANNSDRSLIIADVRTTCSCTVSRYPTRIIPPWGTVQIPVVIHLTTPQDRFAAGVAVLFENSKPRLFSIQGSVILGNPAEVDYGEVVAGMSSTAEFPLKSRSGSPIKVSNVRFDRSILKTVTTEETLEDTKVRMTLSDLIPVGEFKTKVEFQTDDGTLPTRLVNIRGRITSRLIVWPSVVLLPPMQSGEISEFVIKVATRKGENFSLSKITTAPIGLIESFQVIEDNGAEKNVRLRIVAMFESESVMKAAISITGNIANVGHVNGESNLYLFETPH